MTELIADDEDNILGKQFQLTALKLTKNTLNEPFISLEQLIKKKTNSLNEEDTKKVRERLTKMYKTYGKEKDVDSFISKAKKASYWYTDKRFDNENVSEYIQAELAYNKDTNLNEKDAAITWFFGEIDGKIQKAYGKNSSKHNLTNISRTVAVYAGGIGGHKQLSVKEIEEKMSVIETEVNTSLTALKDKLSDGLKARCPEFLDSCGGWNPDTMDKVLAKMLENISNKVKEKTDYKVEIDSQLKGNIDGKFKFDIKAAINNRIAGYKSTSGSGLTTTNSGKRKITNDKGKMLVSGRSNIYVSTNTNNNGFMNSRNQLHGDGTQTITYKDPVWDDEGNVSYQDVKIVNSGKFYNGVLLSGTTTRTENGKQTIKQTGLFNSISSSSFTPELLEGTITPRNGKSYKINRNKPNMTTVHNGKVYKNQCFIIQHMAEGRKDAEDNELQLRANIDQIQSHVVYNTPNFYIYAGPFFTMLEAEAYKQNLSALGKANSKVPDSYMIREYLNCGEYGKAGRVLGNGPAFTGMKSLTFPTSKRNIASTGSIGNSLVMTSKESLFGITQGNEVILEPKYNKILSAGNTLYAFSDSEVIYFDKYNPKVQKKAARMTSAIGGEDGIFKAPSSQYYAFCPDKTYKCKLIDQKTGEDVIPHPEFHQFRSSKHEGEFLVTKSTGTNGEFLCYRITKDGGFNEYKKSSYELHEVTYPKKVSHISGCK